MGQFWDRALTHESRDDLEFRLIGGLGGIVYGLDLDEDRIADAIRNKDEWILETLQVALRLKEEAKAVFWAECSGVEYYFVHSSLDINEKIRHAEIVKNSDLAKDETRQEVIKLLPSLYLKLERSKRSEKPTRKKVGNGGFIYLIMALLPDEPYKIGWARKAKSRLKLFEVNLPFEFETVHVFKADNPQKAEGRLHEIFKGKRTNGEWFHLSEDDVYEIQSICGYQAGGFVYDNGVTP